MKTEEVRLVSDIDPDLVCHVQLTDTPLGWVVEHQTGRISQTLHEGTETEVATTYEDGKLLFDAYVTGRIEDGFVPDAATPFTPGPGRVSSVTSVALQFPRNVTLSDAEALFEAGAQILIQPQHDGDRRSIRMNRQSRLMATNAQAQPADVQASIREGMLRLAGRGYTDTIFDGDDMGSHYALFDVLRLRGEDIRELPFRSRATYLKALARMIDDMGIETLIRVDVPELASSLEEFRRIIARLEQEGCIGAILRLPNAPYTTGQPDHGGIMTLNFAANAQPMPVREPGQRCDVVVRMADHRARTVRSATKPDLESVVAFPGAGLTETG